MKKLGSPGGSERKTQPFLRNLWLCRYENAKGTFFLFTNLNYAIARAPTSAHLRLSNILLNSYCFPMVRDSHTPIDKVYTNVKDSYSY